MYSFPGREYWMGKAFKIVAFIALLGGFLQPVQAGDLAKLSDAAFRRVNVELEKIEKDKGAEAATAEIAIARQWIEQGRLLLREGRVRKAAVVAERFPTELALIRALVAAGAAQDETRRVEEEIHDARNALRRIKSRYNRLVLKIQGAAHTNAFPPKKGDDL